MHCLALLVSSGFSSDSIYRKVEELVNKNNYKNAEIVTTAHPKKENAQWSGITKYQLERLGLSVSFVDFDNGGCVSEDVDLLYVCGGNTFHLLHSIQKSSFPIREQLQRFFNRGGLYIGSSAGAVIFSPTIDSAGEVHPDKNYDNVLDTSGLGYISQHIIPHYSESMESSISDFVSKYNIEDKDIIRLKNGMGVYLYHGNIEII